MSKYTGKNIKEMGYPEICRERPTMFMSNIGEEGIIHMTREILDNSLDEAMNGHADHITVKISNEKNLCSVEDNGRGCPVSDNALYKIYGTLYSSGKYDEDSYKSSGGLNGVGASLVSALSTKIDINVKRNGYLYNQTFSKGVPENTLTRTRKLKKNENTSTMVEFSIDEAVLGTTHFDIETIRHSIEMRSYLFKGITVELIDVDEDKTYTYKHDKGLEDFIDDKVVDTITNTIEFATSEEYDIKKGEETQHNEVNVDVCFAYNKDNNERLLSFCNSLETYEGGTHETGFKIGLTLAIKNYISDNNVLKKSEKSLDINGDDCRNGLHGIISIRHNNPLYEGQHKHKLSNTQVQGIVMKLIKDNMDKYLELNEKDAKRICKRVILSAKSRRAAKKAQEATNKKGESSLSIMSDLSKLSDCISDDVSEKELFIVEGDSAGGTCKKCRNKQNQAIFSLRGKIINTNNRSPLSIVNNKELSDFIYIITGNKGALLDKNFDIIENLKYSKIILLTDADDDGFHIESLILTFIFRHMPELIENGNVYIGVPPLYIVKEGRNEIFINDDEQYDKYISERILKEFKVYQEIKEEFVELHENDLKQLVLDGKYYLDNLNSFLSNYDTFNITLAEYIIHYLESKSNGNVDNITLDSLDNLINYINSDDEDGFRELNMKKVKNVGINIEGFFKDEEHNFYIDDLFIDNVKKLILILDDINNSNDLYIEEDGYAVSKYLGQLVDEMYDKCKPKYRKRLKGLGEMDATDLWKTTMNPDNRRMVKVGITDYEDTNRIIHKLMNSKSKYADQRKKFLLESQSEIKELVL